MPADVSHEWLRYERIAVIGAGGSGKSRLARILGDRLGIEVVHLDRLYWRPGWQRASDEEFQRTHASLVARPRWIIDGNYAGTLDARLAAADAVVFFDFPAWRCVRGAVRRRCEYRRTPRPDVAGDCPERLRLRFLLWLLTFRRHTRPRVVAAIDNARRHAAVYELRSPQAVRRLVERVPFAAPAAPGRQAVR